MRMNGFTRFSLSLMKSSRVRCVFKSILFLILFFLLLKSSFAESPSPLTKTHVIGVSDQIWKEGNTLSKSEDPNAAHSRSERVVHFKDKSVFSQPYKNSKVNRPVLGQMITQSPPGFKPSRDQAAQQWYMDCTVSIFSSSELCSEKEDPKKLMDTYLKTQPDPKFEKHNGKILPNYDVLYYACLKYDDCCRASVEEMKERKLLLKDKRLGPNGCPTGYRPGQHACGGGYAWCAPEEANKR